MYVSGTKRANSRRKSPMTVIAKASRARIWISGLTFTSGEVGSRRFMKMLPKRQRTSEISAMALVEQSEANFRY